MQAGARFGRRECQRSPHPPPWLEQDVRRRVRGQLAHIGTPDRSGKGSNVLQLARGRRASRIAIGWRRTLTLFPG